jgi:hypothetical protein
MVQPDFYYRFTTESEPPYDKAPMQVSRIKRMSASVLLLYMKSGSPLDESAGLPEKDKRGNKLRGAACGFVWKSENRVSRFSLI